MLGRRFRHDHLLDLGGNVRKNPKLSGTTHNVFGIKPGVSINIFIKRKENLNDRAMIFYASTDEWWRKEEKYQYLDKKESIVGINWQEIIPDAKHTWLTAGLKEEFDDLMPLGTKTAKRAKKVQAETIFKTFSLGVSTNRDGTTYDFNKNQVIEKIRAFSDNYNTEVARFAQEQAKTKEPINIDSFVKYDKIQWSRNLKRHLKNCDYIKFSEQHIVTGLYRPFCKIYLYFSDIAVDEPGLNEIIFPKNISEKENKVICVNQTIERPFACLMANKIPNLVFCGGFGSATQCFPFYTYAKDGSLRTENLTDWALEQFRTHYADNTLTKWDIFHYIYALLHHPAYRDKYAANLKRELPRIPFAPDFRAFAQSGAQLADLHVNYESQTPYPLTFIETPGQPLNWRVEKMKLAKDKRSLKYNDYLNLDGIPEEVYGYKLGNRSALEWVIDQYRVKTDKRSGITSDPNRADDPQYIVRLLGQVITVSLETLKIIKALPPLE
jgi:predicted helicase